MEQTDYMQQEDMWDREGLLDPAWERQQRKVSAGYLYSQVDHLDIEFDN